MCCPDEYGILLHSSPARSNPNSTCCHCRLSLPSGDVVWCYANQTLNKTAKTFANQDAQISNTWLVGPPPPPPPSGVSGQGAGTCDLTPSLTPRVWIGGPKQNKSLRRLQALRSMRSTRARLSQQCSNFEAVATDVATLTVKVNAATDRGLTDL